LVWFPSLQVILVGPAEIFAKGSPINNAVLKAAAAQKGKIIYVLADRDGPDAVPILEFFGLQKDEASKEPQVGTGACVTDPQSAHGVVSSQHGLMLLTHSLECRMRANSPASHCSNTDRLSGQ
jgi:hypothetical protein